MESCFRCRENTESNEMIRNSNICKTCKKEYNSITNKYPTCKNSKRIYEKYGKYKHVYGSQKLISHCKQEVFNYFIRSQKHFYFQYYSALYSPYFKYVEDHILPLSLFKDPLEIFIGCHWLDIHTIPLQLYKKKGKTISPETIRQLILNFRLAKLFGINLDEYDLNCLIYLIDYACRICLANCLSNLLGKLCVEFAWQIACRIYFY